jgi:hypothetical protein
MGTGSPNPTDAVDGEAEFVAQERAFLGNPTGEMSKAWLRENVNTVLRTYHRWLTLFARLELKRFPLTPFFKIKRHFINIDSKVIRTIMSSKGYLKRVWPDTTRTVKKNGEDVLVPHISDDLVWSLAFDFSSLTTSKWKFSRMLDVDGVCGCVHFKTKKSDAELAAMERKKADIAAATEAKAARKLFQAEHPEKAEAELKAKRKAAAAARAAVKTEKREVATAATEAKGLGHPASTEYEPPDLREGESSSDPGTNPNVLYTVYKKDGKIKRANLTIGQYYTDSGVRSVKKQAEKLMKQIHAEQTYVDEVSHRSPTLYAFTMHIERYLQVYDVLWKQKLRRVWARGRFRTYIGKPMAQDAYYRKLKADGAGIRKAYIGGGRWSPSQKGRETGPVDLVSRRFRRYHSKVVKRPFVKADSSVGVVCEVESHAVTVDEHLTSQCCWKCGCRTRPVYERVEHDVETREMNRREGEVWKNDKMVRGLRFCDSKSCGCLIDRDFQGAMNILACGMAEEEGRDRPHHLTRESRATKRTDKFFLPFASARQARRTTRQTREPPILAYSTSLDMIKLRTQFEACPISI